MQATSKTQRTSIAHSHGTMYGVLFILLLLVGGVGGCGDDQSLLVVDVQGVPADARSLQVTATLDGQPAMAPAVFTQELAQFGVRIPSSLRGNLILAVEATDANGCSLARGQLMLTLDGGAEYQVSLQLVVLPATLCAIRVSKTGDGSGVIKSAPAGIDCGATCTSYFILGQQVVLSASAGASSHFLGWNGPCGGAGDCTFTVSSAAEVTAMFRKAQPRLCPQSGWCWENPGPHGNNQLKLWGTSGRNLWSVGVAGTIGSSKFGGPSVAVL